MQGRKIKSFISKLLISGALLWCVFLSGCGNSGNMMEASDKNSNESTQVDSIIDSSQDFTEETTKNLSMQESTTQSAILPQNEILQVEHPEEVNLAGMLQDTAGKTMVRVQAGDFVGSGVILAADEKNIYIATAGHVLGQTDQNVKVTFVDAAVVKAKEVFRSSEYDLAILQLATKDVLSAHSREEDADPAEETHATEVAQKSGTTEVAQDPGTTEVAREAGAMAEIQGKYATVAIQDNNILPSPVSGDPAILISSVNGVAKEAYEGIILEPWIYVEDFQCDMLLLKLDAEPGMSGGGVFTEQGYFLGILCGIDEDGEAAVLPAQMILNYREHLGS